MKLTAESFLTVVKKSGLVQPEQLNKVVTDLQQNGGPPENSQSLAAAFVDRKLLTQWQADKLQQGKSRGFFLGKYRLLSLLGKGGMSSVYLAEHVLMRRRCAIKVLPQKRVNDSSYLGRFHREAQAVASLDHPNIVRAYDVDSDKNVEKNKEIHFLVMEYVAGLSLQDLITQDGVLDPVTAADYVRQAADGLAHAHEAGMVHRDIKPGNLLVDLDGAVKMLDLGLARFFDDDSEASLTVTHDEKVLGTADYLAPEQALDSHSVDARADIYSLGCTMYFLLTGHPPFTTGTLAQRLMAHQTQEPPRIKAERKDVPEDLLAIVDRMMAKKAGDRFQSAAETSETLADWLQRNAPEEWKAQHALPLSGGSGPITAGGSGTSPAGPPAEDNNLANFLSTLHETPTGSGAYERKRKAGTSTHVLADSSDEVDVPATDNGNKTADTDKTMEVVTPPRAVPVAKPVETPQPPAPAAAEIARPPQSSGTLRLVLIGVVGLLVVAGIVFGVVKWIGTSEDPGTGPVAKTKTQPNGKQPKRPKEDLLVGPKQEFPTIGKAMTEAISRFEAGHRKPMKLTIRVAGGRTYKERIVLDNANAGIDELSLTIVCTDSKPAVLAPDGPKPVVRLVKTSKLTLAGFTIKSDKIAEAVHVEGYCAGLLLKQLKITGFTRTGIATSALQGFQNFGGERNIVSFEDLTFESKSPAAKGLHFRGETNRVAVSRCRFLGPMEAGVLVSNDTFHTDISHCIFHKLKDGIRFARPLRLRNLAIRDNTFHDSDNGITFQNMPIGDTSGLVLSANLFAKIRQFEASIRRPAKYPPNKFRGFLAHPSTGMERNMTDRKPPAKVIPFFFQRRGKIQVKVAFDSTDTKSENFLMPKKGAVHAKIGARKTSP